LPKKETKEQKAADLEKEAEEAVEPEAEAQETAEPEAKTPEVTKERLLVGEQPVEEAEEVPKAPEPIAIGDEKIAILKHDIYRKGGDDTTEAVSIELAVKNVSDTAIGSALFEAELYDIEGNILDKVERKTVDFKQNITRTIQLDYSGPESDKVRSYCVKISKVAMTPESKVTGNEKIKILKHSLNTGDGEFAEIMADADFAIKNVSDTTIASLVFEAEFYDIEGNVLDTVKRSEIEIKPNTSRAVTIKCKQQLAQRIKGYDIKIARMITADVEKIQLRSNERRTTDIGEEVRGIVKNVGSVKTDTALVATFFNSQKESIGTKVVILRDIEPNNAKQFHFVFKPMEGDEVRSYTLNIGDLAE